MPPAGAESAAPPTRRGTGRSPIADRTRFAVALPVDLDVLTGCENRILQQRFNNGGGLRGALLRIPFPRGSCGAGGVARLLSPVRTAILGHLSPSYFKVGNPAHIARRRLSTTIPRVNIFSYLTLFTRLFP